MEAKKKYDTKKKGSPVKNTYEPGRNRASKKPARDIVFTEKKGSSLKGSRGTPLHKGKLGR